jgi:hypothetical protein
MRRPKGISEVSVVKQDLKSKTDAEIDAWILNHEPKNATSADLYRELLEERARRNSHGLNIDKSMAHLMESARLHHFTTYGDLAAASEVPWSQARHRMNGHGGHLDRLLDVGHAPNLPLLTSVCVNQKGNVSGALDAKSLQGFVNGARRLGYTVADGNEFLRRCQDESFLWGEKHKSPVG